MGSAETKIENHTARIEFYHPSHNSLPSNLLHRLVAAIEEAGKNDQVRVIILTSAGERTFCAGASFDELAAIEDLEAGKQFFSGFAGVINAMRKCPKFIIVRVQGKAIGGGVGIASAGDYSVATNRADVKLSELAVGIGPFVIGPAVERKMGLSPFTELALNATEFRTAQWAKSKGLYNEIFETTEQMDVYIQKLATTLVNSSTDAMTELKRVFWAGTEHWDELLAQRAAMSGRLVLSEFSKSAIADFKRKS
jgi:methylglutaconyl-CoA hydratase